MKNILRKTFVLFTIISCAICVNAQSTRIYRDAEAFDLKGHVKKVVISSSEASDALEEWSFLSNGSVSTDKFDLAYISRDKQNRLKGLTVGDLDLQPISEDDEDNEDDLGLSHKDFFWRMGEYGLNLDSEATVFKQLTQSRFNAYGAMVESRGVSFEWSGNRVSKCNDSGSWGEYSWQRSAQEWEPTMGGRTYASLTSYKFNAKGNISKAVVEYMGGEKYSIIYTYLKFDSKGNWTKRKAKSSDGKTTIETRTITYYK